jgi:hypothetical protein
MSIKISQLPSDSSPTTDDVVSGVDVNTTATKKFSIANLITLIFNNIPTNGLPSGKFSNPYKFSAYLGSNQTTVAATFTKLNYNTESYDTNSNYDTTTYGYTAPINGFYRFTLTAILQNQAGLPFLISLGKNSTSEFVRLVEVPNTTGNITLSGSVDLQLNAGDVIYPLYYSTSASKTILASNQYCRFSGFLISAV